MRWFRPVVAFTAAKQRVLSAGIIVRRSDWRPGFLIVFSHCDFVSRVVKVRWRNLSLARGLVKHSKPGTGPTCARDRHKQERLPSILTRPSRPGVEGATEDCYQYFLLGCRAGLLARVRTSSAAIETWKVAVSFSPPPRKAGLVTKENGNLKTGERRYIRMLEN